MEKTHPNFQGRPCPSTLQKALRLHRKWLCSALRLVVGARIDPPERKALPVLARRGSIGIENISLVQHGIGNFIDRRRIHIPLITVQSSVPRLAILAGV